jgi:hypothetical protein
MPNHVVNELIFRGTDRATQALILSKLCNDRGEVDFEILVPSPINIWLGSVGRIHTDTFPDTHLDWARKNWGTKWNAYSQKPTEQTEDTLTLRFETAWRPPYGWLVAIFNTFKCSFEHNWFSEGEDRGRAGKWNYAGLDDLDGLSSWEETDADDDLQKHLHVLQWGVENLEEIA